MAKKASQEVLAPVEQNAYVTISSLFPHAKNYNQHPPEQMRKLKASLKRFGQVRSIVAQVQENGTYTIIAGHGIVQAAQELIEEDIKYLERFSKLRVDVIPSSWPVEQVNGYLVSDNLTSADAVADNDILVQLLQEQAEIGQRLLSVGSSDEDLRQLLREVQNSHAADFLKDVLQPPPQAPVQPYRPENYLSRDTNDEDGEEEVYAHHPNGSQPPPFRTPSFSAPAVSPVQEDIQWFPVTYTVTQEQREIILSAIKKAKGMWQLQTSAEAIVQICAQFVRE